jgi:hypothetical protein
MYWTVEHTAALFLYFNPNSFKQLQQDQQRTQQPQILYQTQQRQQQQQTQNMSKYDSNVPVSV